MFLHITFTDGSNPYVKFYLNDTPEKSVAKDLRSWKRHYVIVNQYTTDDGDIMLTVRHKTHAEEREMKIKNKERYKTIKERVRQEAIDWQADFPNHNYSWGEIAYFEDYFRRQGKRYGLLTEFRENCIC